LEPAGFHSVSQLPRAGLTAEAHRRTAHHVIIAAVIIELVSQKPHLSLQIRNVVVSAVVIIGSYTVSRESERGVTIAAQ